MLLLYHGQLEYLIAEDFLYIPLCFYFIRYLRYVVTRCFALHSIMLLLYRARSWLRYCASFLYIPLCFYFISWTTSWQSTPGRSLHSIMLLLYQLRVPWKCHKQIALHSIMLLLYPTPASAIRATWVLYIPLCFYFIAEAEHFHVSAPISTFHYASTLSLSGGRRPVPSSPSTFHYASTLSLLKLDPTNTQLSLHSIMLLLYLVRHTSALDIIILYIPLCFYFISSSSSSPQSSSSSTFHYASTLSVQCVLQFGDTGALHSIMLLLYPDSTSPTSAEKSSTFHYASTLSF